jgi:Tol biopolymer transport system component
MAVVALFQTACMSMVCLVVVLMAAGVITLEEVRCKLSNSCVTPVTLAPGPKVTPSPLPATRVSLSSTADAPCGAAMLQDRASKVSFVSDRQDEYGAVYLTDVNNPQASCRFLVNSQGIYSISWANDHRIAFSSSKGLWVSSAEGSGLERITDFPIGEGSVDWSPDGKRLVFAMARGKFMSTNVMDADGTNRRELTTDGVRNPFPRWSPDGTQIVLAADRADFNQIYIVDADGTNERLISGAQAHDDHPAWSPDGTQIVFDSDREGNRDIYTMNVDGSNVRRLTNAPGRDEQPAWSTDGKQIAFVSYRDGNNEIYVMNADGTNPRRLTFNLADDSRPAWVR